MVNILFDATVIVNAKTAGNLHSTGLYRVSSEILNELIKRDSFNVYLFDILYRERELIYYVIPDYPGCTSLKVHSEISRNIFFPFGNLADHSRKKQSVSKNKVVAVTYKILKIAALTVYKNSRRFEKKYIIHKNFSNRLKAVQVYYSTYFPIPDIINKKKNILRIWTLHDLIPMVHPEYFSSPFNEKILREVTNNIQLSDIVYCVSDATRSDLLRFRPDLNPANIFITPNAASDHFFPVDDVNSIENCKDKYGLNRDDLYFLSLCTLEPRKNLKTLVKVYEKLLEEFPGFPYYLVLTGAPGWNIGDLIERIDKINMKYGKKIIQTGFIPEADLAPLYSGATAFIYPSLYEGFGLPVLEAMKCGTPVVSSNSSSLPEVVGDAGILTDPLDQQGLIEAIKSLATNSKMQADMRKKSIKQSYNFSWANTGDIIEQTIFNRPN